MRIHGIRLQKSQRFACSRRSVKELFETNALAWVSFGFPVGSFNFDSRCHHQPHLHGSVAASLSVTRAREAHLCLYPLLRTDYPDCAADEFADRVLPKFCNWLQTKQSRPDTLILGHEEIIAEWAHGTHTLHEVRFL